MADPYVYPYTVVLKNKFSIKDKDVLDTMEADFTELRIRELWEHPVKGNFDFEHFCAVHAYIFQDVYEWAGKPRTIEIEKAEKALGGISIEYGKSQNIVKDAGFVLERMNGRCWETMSVDERAKAFAEDMADLWKVHCFREGNTRTSVIFCCDFADSHGFPIDRSLFEQNSSYMRTSLVAASAKFSDLGDLSRPEHLIRIIKDGMQRGETLSKAMPKMCMEDWRSQIDKERETNVADKAAPISNRSLKDKNER